MLYERPWIDSSTMATIGSAKCSKKITYSKNNLKSSNPKSMRLAWWGLGLSIASAARKVQKCRRKSYNDLYHTEKPLKHQNPNIPKPNNLFLSNLTTAKASVNFSCGLPLSILSTSKPSRLPNRQISFLWLWSCQITTKYDNLTWGGCAATR